MWLRSCDCGEFSVVYSSIDLINTTSLSPLIMSLNTSLIPQSTALSIPSFLSDNYNKWPLTYIPIHSHHFYILICLLVLVCSKTTPAPLLSILPKKKKEQVSQTMPPLVQRGYVDDNRDINMLFTTGQGYRTQELTTLLEFDRRVCVEWLIDRVMACTLINTGATSHQDPWGPLPPIPGRLVSPAAAKFFEK